MTDTVSKRVRSKIMQAVRSAGNKSTEGRLISIFRARGITGWRRHAKVEGRPDFVFPKRKIAVFADGCFWHGHTCRNVSPKTNKKFWTEKIEGNKLRAKRVNVRLRALGWHVYRIWECSITKGQIPKRLFEMLTATYRRVDGRGK